MPGQNRSRRSREHSNGCSPVAISTLLCDNAQAPEKGPSSVTQNVHQKSDPSLEQRKKTPREKSKINFGTFVGHLLHTKQISHTVAKHIAQNAWHLGVMARLDMSTCRWFDYCRSAKKSVIGFNLNQCLEFLHPGVTVWNLMYYLLRACKEFLFNVSRFITSPFTASDKECIKQFLRGVFNTNPPVRQRPQLVTWNVDVVLDYLSGAGDNDAIPLNNLAGKACMLIMLSTMCRMGDAFQLDTREMARTEEYISFRLSHPTKTFTDNSCDFGSRGATNFSLAKIS